LIHKTLLALAGSAALITNVWAADSYPRTAAISTGGQQEYWDATYQREIAKFDVAIISTYPGWGKGRGTTMQNAVSQIKAINPNTKVFLYTLGESLRMPVDATWSTLANTVEANKWWLYSAGTSGSKLLSSYGNGHYALNISSQSRKNSSGQNFAQWYGSWVAATLGKPVPSADGMFMDNIYYAPRTDGDWNVDGSKDSQTNATVGSWFRQGNVQFLNSLKAGMGKIHIANAADWGLEQAVLTDYVGKFQGAVFEGMLGRSYSIEGYAGWAAMMKGYRKIMATVAAPKYVVCVQGGGITDYQAMRYGLASCSMDDGYYFFTNNADPYHHVPRFDEYEANLGMPTSSPPTAAWQSGVYRRDFEGGIVLVNPKGNGSRTVNLGGEFVKLRGTQVPAINNGATVTSVKLADRDGLILLRKGVAPKPAAPAGFTVK
jgi:hypothetical protein